MVGLEDLLNKRCRIGFYSVYLVSLQGLPFIQLYFILIDLHRHLFIHNVLRPNGEYTKSTAETINCLLDTLALGSREVRVIYAAEETDENIEVTMDDEIVNSICSAVVWLGILFRRFRC